MSLRLRNPLTMLRSHAVALDMGTGATRIALADGTVALSEPTVVALEHGGLDVLAIGEEAKTYLGKAPDRIRVVQPVVAGAVVEFEAARELLRRFLARALPADGRRIKALVVAPHGLTDLERRTLTDCCKAAGISQAHIVSAPLCAAVGAGADIAQPKGRLLLGIGAGLAEASLVSLGGVVGSEAAPCGALSFHAAVARHLAEHRQLNIGGNMAEQATLKLACVSEPDAPRTLTVTGKLAATGSPCAMDLTHADLAGALDSVLDELTALVRAVMERTPAELVADVGEAGLLLYGGGAKLCGLPQLLSPRLGYRVSVAEEPELAPLRGAVAALRPDAPLRKLLVR